MIKYVISGFPTHVLLHVDFYSSKDKRPDMLFIYNRIHKIDRVNIWKQSYNSQTRKWENYIKQEKNDDEMYCNKLIDLCEHFLMKTLFFNNILYLIEKNIGRMKC